MFISNGYRFLEKIGRVFRINKIGPPYSLNPGRIFNLGNCFLRFFSQFIAGSRNRGCFTIHFFMLNHPVNSVGFAMLLIKSELIKKIKPN